MKNKLLELIIFILMFCTTQIPNMLFHVYFQYSTEPSLEIYACRYVLTTIAWLIFLYYIVKRLLLFLQKASGSCEEHTDIS